MKVFTPEECAELRQLYAELPHAHARVAAVGGCRWHGAAQELPHAHARVAAALRTERPAHQLTAEGMSRLMEAEKAASAIVRRIKELQGMTGGQP